MKKSGKPYLHLPSWVWTLLLAFTISSLHPAHAGTPQKKSTPPENKTNKSKTVDDARAGIHKPLPETLTSFGAAVLGDYLYVFSGHSGDAHGEGKDLLVDHFRRIKVDDPQAEWEELARHEPAQSTALITDGEYLYRIGGLSFLNSSGEETNFNSTQHFSRYDVQNDKWTELAPLPEPRSSLDAAILGRTVYVAGGWNLQGEINRNVTKTSRTWSVYQMNALKNSLKRARRLRKKCLNIRNISLNRNTDIKGTG